MIRDPSVWMWGKLERNRLIYDDRTNGLSYRVLAEKYGLSLARIGQIIAKERRHRKWQRRFARQQKKLHLGG